MPGECNLNRTNGRLHRPYRDGSRRDRQTTGSCTFRFFTFLTRTGRTDRKVPAGEDEETI